MPRACTVCRHQQRAAIDDALVAQAPMRNIAERFGLSLGSLHRHAVGHLPAALARAADAAEETRADTLLDRLRALNRETADVLAAAKRERDHDLRLRAIARAERQLELEARLLGELTNGQTTNVVVLPEWVGLRGAILAALAAFPEARLTVAAALAAEVGDAG